MEPGKIITISDQSSKSCVPATHRSIFLRPANAADLYSAAIVASIPIPEEQPLLRNELSPATPSPTVHPDSQDQSAPSSSHLTRKQYIRLLVCANAIFILTGFAGMLLDVPLVRLLERAACQDYYLNHLQLSSPSSNAVNLFSKAIDETRCNMVPIQSRVATLVGGKTAFDAGLACRFVYSNSRSAPEDCFGLLIHE